MLGVGVVMALLIAVVGSCIACYQFGYSAACSQRARTDEDLDDSEQADRSAKFTLLWTAIIAIVFLLVSTLPYFIALGVSSHP